jgi:hypothetical protein
MQESDEWNAELQEDNIKLEADVKAAKAQGLRNTLSAAVIGALAGFLLSPAFRLLQKLKIAP